MSVRGGGHPGDKPPLAGAAASGLPASEAGGSQPPVWGVRGLTVTYGRNHALTDVTLAVPPGRITAVVGGDGAGKTTLLRALAGLVRPAAGIVTSPGRASLGFVSAEGGAYRDLTVDENLAFSGRGYRMTPQQLANREKLLLERIGLADARGRLGGQLSGGMRQKLAVGMALLHEPPLLILDEPTTGVDPVSRVDLWRLITRAAAAGTAVLLSTTYVDEAERAATVCVLDRGRTLLHGTPDEVVATVAGRLYSSPVGNTRPAESAWRSGTTWRVFVPAGEVPPDGALPSAADLNDAVIAAALGLTGHEQEGAA